MKKILIIGKNGQLGQELLTQAIDYSFEAIGVGREEVDVTDKAMVEKIISEIQPEIVINTSAYHVVPDCENYPDRAFAVNSAAVKHLAEFCANSNRTFVTYSTDYVFDGRKGSPYTENDTPNPLQVYGLTKYSGEILTRLYAKDYYIIRPNAVYGGKTGSRSKKGNFILSILKQAEEKEIIEVSSELIISSTYAYDLAKASFKLFTKRPESGIYHLTNSGYCSWAELAQETLRIRGSNTRIIPVDRSGMDGAMRRPLFTALDCSKASRYGIELPHWKDALGRYLQS